ncbi:MAG TPA: hypothetical protein VN289_06660 [Paraburkholderia sp.]|nr:hypothetical protein [Paraburkholderia sp.]
MTKRRWEQALLAMGVAARSLGSACKKADNGGVDAAASGTAAASGASQ